MTVTGSPKTRTRVPLRGKDGVYKRGGVWFAIVEFPRAKTGERVRKRTEGFKTRKEAEAERDRLRSQIRSGVDTPPEKLTVNALLDRWFAGKSDLAATTRQRYEGIIARAKPYLGAMLVDKIRPAHISEYFHSLRAECRVCTLRKSRPAKRRHVCRSGLSKTSVLHAKNLLVEVFEWAKRLQIIVVNPIDAVRDDLPKRSAPKVDAFSDSEITALLDAARRTRWETAIMLALATGIRRGELAALRWDDVHIENAPSGIERGTITVQASISETKFGLERKSTKTGRARRVPLSSLAIEALHTQRFRQSEDAFKAEEAYEPSGFVFTDKFGRPCRPLAFTDGFTEIRKQAGVTKRLHDARHTAASHLLAAGVDIRTAATILGHSSPTTTLVTYSHQLAGLTEDAVIKLDGRLRAAIERNRDEEK